jgi:hypothetical protein
MSISRCVSSVCVIALAAGCEAASPAPSADSIRAGVTLAIDSLLASMESLNPDRMLAAWQPAPDVLHVSDTAVLRIDTLLPSLRPVWAARREFRATWSMLGLRPLGSNAAVATTRVRFVATDTLGATTTRDGVWTIVLDRSRGKWEIVADHRTMAFGAPRIGDQPSRP